MAETDALLDTLKRQLRSRRKTYRDVAEALELSEASVKRLFAGGDLSLRRLERICALLDLEIADLVREARREAHTLTRLSEAQEREIASDLKLLLVTVCALNRWRMEEILAHFRLTEPECIHHLARLDRLGLIELLPGNRIRLRVAPNFAWRRSGPIQRFFQERVKEDFFRSRFAGDEEQLVVVNGMLSRASHELFRREVRRLQRSFDQLSDADAELPLEQRFGVTLVLAHRPWGFGVFAGLRRGGEGNPH